MAQQENKYRYLIKNVGVLTIGSFGSKFLSFFLLPLYTSILTTEEYGISDFIHATVNLLIPVFTLNISDAVFRISMEKGRDREEVFRTGCQVFGAGFLLVVLFFWLNKIVQLNTLLSDYSGWCLFLYLTQAVNSILLQYARAMDQVSDVAVSGIISAFSIAVINILCIVVFSMGLRGYLFAMVSGQALADFYLLYRLKAGKILCRIRCRVSKELCRDMIAYSLPLVVTTISWWVISASDRYMVIWLCGVVENGIYSVAYKIPGILSVMQNLFTQAWQISAVKEQENDSAGGFYKEVYTQYHICTVMVSAGLIGTSRLMAGILFSNDFYRAWNYVPWLLFATLFSGLSGYMGGILAALKDTKALSVSCAAGAIVNIILNMILLKTVGTIGAAYATLISYMVTFVCRIIFVKKDAGILLITGKNIWMYVLIFMECCVVGMENRCLRYSITGMLVFIMLAVNLDTIRTAICKLSQMRKLRRK